MRLKKMPDTLLLMDRLRGPSSQVYFTISALNKITFRKQGVPKRMREREKVSLESNDDSFCWTYF
jgi:hypothetical protein